jgi:hypothetical protein
MEKPRVRGETWREDLQREGIIYVSDPEEVRRLLAEKIVLPCTRCSKTKGSEGDEAVPRNFYLSRQNIRFYEWAEAYNLEYGILSDLYGMHFWDVKKPFYDIHPSSLTEEQFQELGRLIKEEMDSRGYRAALYWNSSPVMSVPYFYMFKMAGIQVYYITKLPSLKMYSFDL